MDPLTEELMKQALTYQDIEAIGGGQAQAMAHRNKNPLYTSGQPLIILLNHHINSFPVFANDLDAQDMLRVRSVYVKLGPNMTLFPFIDRFCETYNVKITTNKITKKDIGLGDFDYENDSHRKTFRPLQFRDFRAVAQREHLDPKSAVFSKKLDKYENEEKNTQHTFDLGNGPFADLPALPNFGFSNNNITNDNNNRNMNDFSIIGNVANPGNLSAFSNGGSFGFTISKNGVATNDDNFDMPAIESRNDRDSVMTNFNQNKNENQIIGRNFDNFDSF